jgi:hypothetical protein
MPNLLTLWDRASTVPQGRRVFSMAFSRKAPYFSTVKPLFIDLRPHYAELLLKDRKAATTTSAPSTPSRSATGSKTSGASPRPTPSSGMATTPTCRSG